MDPAITAVMAVAAAALVVAAVLTVNWWNGRPPTKPNVTGDPSGFETYDGRHH